MANFSNIVSCNLNKKNFTSAEFNAENAGQWLDIVIDMTDFFKKNWFAIGRYFVNNGSIWSFLS